MTSADSSWHYCSSSRWRVAGTRVCGQDYRAERFDVNLVVEPGGAMVVTERIRFVFGDDSFTYVYRGLRSRRTDGVTIVSVPWTAGRSQQATSRPVRTQARGQRAPRRLAFRGADHVGSYVRTHLPCRG